MSEIVVHKGDEPDVLVDLPHAHQLSRKHLTEIHLATREADAGSASRWSALMPRMSSSVCCIGSARVFEQELGFLRRVEQM